MKVEFDEWRETDWYTRPSGTRTEDLPGYKKRYGGVGFTELGRVYVSKKSRWRKAIFWHEKGHCLLFESGRIRTLGHTSIEEEILADTVADTMAGTYQTLGMLVMILRRAKGRNIDATKKRIEAVCQRHPETAKEILDKIDARKIMTIVVNYKRTEKLKNQ